MRELPGELVGEITIRRACVLYNVEMSFYQALVNEGVFPHSRPSAYLRRKELNQLRTAARLFNDLGVNPAGIAIILDLLDRRA